MNGAAADRTCANCKHWDRDGGEYEFFEAPLDDDAPEAPLDDIANAGGSSFCMTTATPNVPAFVLDGSGYTAKLWTRPSFGCVLFEPRP